jgi:hypothetical protein
MYAPEISKGLTVLRSAAIDVELISEVTSAIPAAEEMRARLGRGGEEGRDGGSRLRPDGLIGGVVEDVKAVGGGAGG